MKCRIGNAPELDEAIYDRGSHVIRAILEPHDHVEIGVDRV